MHRSKILSRNTQELALLSYKKSNISDGTYELACHEIGHLLISLCFDSPVMAIAVNEVEGANFRVAKEKHIAAVEQTVKALEHHLNEQRRDEDVVRGALRVIANGLRRCDLILLGGEAAEAIAQHRQPDINSYRCANDIKTCRNQADYIQELVQKAYSSAELTLNTDDYFRDLLSELHNIFRHHCELLCECSNALARKRLFSLRDIESLQWKYSRPLTKLRWDIKNAESSLPTIWTYFH